MAVQEINESLEFNFFERSVKSEKKLTIITQGFEDVIRVRGTQLVNNKQNNNKEHISFAFLEKQGKPDEADQCIDCMLVVKEKDVCKNCEKLRKTMQQICQRLLIMNSTKTVHASKDILIEKVKKQQRLIKMQNEIILNMKKYLQQKIKLEEVEISDEMANVVYIVANNVARWQDKITYRILENLTINNIWEYGQVGFFSHDSFKIQKGLLWNQCKNCYVGYLDFENEIQDYEAFALQCKLEIKSTNSLPNLSISSEQKYDLATQVHQIVWHSITYNFSYPISYYEINNMKAYNLNTLIFSLAAKLECIGIHIIALICDGAEGNRIHIKSFD
ncbi:hypothetical protein GLOIN_2v1479937 [Rhizophagus irregularis DAOM 181602=DAOM 197198]|uniref:Transposable element P transposase-like RNase H domain-containing protein n=1 Tax=Rhizophagus irregularis (strain DAOM 181602 / DAOM 197198 / MUCL 43194) TaxID=747089 RepID=A0A2P4PW26_RHIID|nr:hypothetical protein GLOIN_2v1479937 [Rhizophagus irregularis DAOM 181602=DAOM 197198]POG69584.1 hypothetical protein GLOIN_2v1479937 [Rhizophagus irregularis DAOM 181602=DAOM 197198]|eukprot:XP_025176450.1 hypothetical protein GLOIN_2v1479937 [Rhizophagus irregularis DAOM 181602=DAOM 197198]